MSPCCKSFEIRFENKIFLNIERCDISFEGAQFIAEALEVNKTLRNLNLSWNLFGPDSCYVLAEALKKNRSLDLIEIYYCDVDNEGAQYFYDALSVNRKININLADNLISQDFEYKIERKISRNLHKSHIEA